MRSIPPAGRSIWEFSLVVAFVALLLGASSATAQFEGCGTNGECSDGRFCNGEEFCQRFGGFDVGICRSGAPVSCIVGMVCSEEADRCEPPPPICAHDADCQDALVCNGAERCEPGTPGADSRGCHPANRPACNAGELCDEATDRCELSPFCASAESDADGDGAQVPPCGTDCDDSDGTRFPGAPENCSTGGPGHDEDCNPRTFARPSEDRDGDGYIDVACFNDFASLRSTGNDCDDSNSSVHPNQAEVCNGIDDNCSSGIDEGLLTLYLADEDADGFASLESRTEAACPQDQPFRFTRTAGDCDDTNAVLRPGSMICDPDSSGVIFCDEKGSPVFQTCDAGTACAEQPNGTGLCVPVSETCDEVVCDLGTVCVPQPDGSATCVPRPQTCEEVVCGVGMICVPQPDGSGICTPEKPKRF